MPEQQGRVHAVVWRSGSLPVPRDLVAALGRRGVRWEEAAGSLEAFSRVLGARRISSDSRVLLLVEPETLPGVEEVRRGLERFDPDARCWAYSAGASPRLSPMAALAREPEVVVRAPTGRGRGPGLRLTGQDAGAASEQKANLPEGAVSGAENGAGGASRGGEEEARVPRSLLTPEELAMLLADDR